MSSRNNIFSAYRRKDVIKGNQTDGTVDQLNGTRGHVLLYDEETLSVFVHAKNWRLIGKRIPNASIFSEGEVEGTFRAPLASLPEAAEAVGAIKRRVPSEAQLAHLREIGGKGRFVSKKHGAGD